MDVEMTRKYGEKKYPCRVYVEKTEENIRTLIPV
jgi:ferredoxin-thioredoxin reductase catalytic subunit